MLRSAGVKLAEISLVPMFVNEHLTNRPSTGSKMLPQRGFGCETSSVGSVGSTVISAGSLIKASPHASRYFCPFPKDLPRVAETMPNGLSVFSQRAATMNALR